MIEVRAAVSLPRFPRDTVALVDETDEHVRKRIRGGYLIPLDHASPDPVTPGEANANGPESA